MSNLFKNLALLLGTLVVLFLLLEAAVRVMTDTPIPMIRRDREIGGRYAYDAVTTIFAPESGREVVFRTNREGFRGVNLPYEKPAGVTRIAVVGDSQVAAVNTQFEDSLTAVLEREVSSRLPEARFEVMNFGVSGASTAQELVLYQRRIAAYQPDVVVCAFFNGNDIADNSRRLSGAHPRIYMDFADDGRLETYYPSITTGTKNWLKSRSRFYTWQKHLFRRAKKVLLEGGAMGRDERFRGGILAYVQIGSDAKLAHGWRITRRLIEEFDRTVRADGRVFVLLSIPAALEIDPAIRAAEHQRMADAGLDDRFDPEHARRQLEATSVALGIHHVFAADSLRQALERGRESDPGYQVAYLGGTGHLNENGQRIVAQALAEFLVERGLLQPQY